MLAADRGGHSPEAGTMAVPSAGQELTQVTHLMRQCRQQGHGMAGAVFADTDDRCSASNIEIGMNLGVAGDMEGDIIRWR